MPQRLVLVLVLVLSVLPLETALAAKKLDVAAEIPVFEELLRNENLELVPLADAQAKIAAGENGCAAGRQADIIVNAFKRSMLLAGDAQDILVCYVFIMDGLSQIHVYAWTRLNRMRLLAFGCLTDAREALEALKADGRADAPPIFEKAVARIQDIHDAIKAMETRFEPLAAAGRTAQ